MKIDIWTHFLSPAYVRHLEGGGPAGRPPAAASFLLANQALRDLDRRFEVSDRFGDYRQILTPVPGLQLHPGLGSQAVVDLVRRNNEQMAEIVSLHEDRYDPLFAAMERLEAAVLLHPFRSPVTPGLPKETAPFLLWQVFGWTFDTTITIFRLIFAGIFDRHPRIKLVAHHGCGLLPHFSGRIEMLPLFVGLDDSLGDALECLQKRPIEYCKMLYVDTAMFGARHGVECVVRFFGHDHVLFGTDTPFDARGGSHFIPATISDVEGAVPDQAARAVIFEGNARKTLGIDAAQ